jgi:hypothetical protein
MWSCCKFRIFYILALPGVNFGKLTLRAVIATGKYVNSPAKQFRKKKLNNRIKNLMKCLLSAPEKIKTPNQKIGQNAKCAKFTV